VFLGLPDPDPDSLIRAMDPDPDPAWIRIRILLGSGSGSFYHHAENGKKNLDSYYLVTLFDFLSLKNDVNVASKSNRQKKLC
jgi:hypothetical protein